MFHIVTHCFCPPSMAFYANALLLHGRSISAASFKAGCDATLWIVRLEQDHATRNAVRALQSERAQTLTIKDHPCPDGTSFFRRSLQRHEILHQIASMHGNGQPVSGIWLADCDYVIQPPFFQSVIRAVAEKSACYPQEYKICSTHALGDRMLSEWCEYGIPRPFPEYSFIPERPPRAVGGMMFISAAVASHGYVPPGSRWLRPTHWQRFESFGCDISHRRHLSSQGVPYQPAKMTGLYRLRHTRAGYKKSDFQSVTSTIECDHAQTQ